MTNKIMTNHAPELLGTLGLATWFSSLWHSIPDAIAPLMALLGLAMLVLSIIAKGLEIYHKYYNRKE